VPRPIPRIRPFAIGALLLAALARAAAAQGAGLVLEVHGGAAVPLSGFADGSGMGEGTTAGPSLSFAFMRPNRGRRAIYVGFSQHRFGCEDAGCVAEGRYVATGFDVGVRFALLASGPVMPWIRLGGITTRVETDDLGGANAGVSDLGFGGEVGAGVYIGRSSSFAVNPGVRYALIDTRLPGGDTLSMRYLVAQLAIALAF
jgi:hypothetical protein